MFYNSDILIQNIRNQMKEKGITQQKLADELGMSQANVSKALNPNDKKSFTLDQAVGIAKFFNTSLDLLVGNNNGKYADLSPRAVASFISRLIESNDAEFVDIENEEVVFWVDWDHAAQYGGYPDSGNERRKNKYLAIYLPSYWQLPIDAPEPVYEELLSEASQVGNDTKMQAVNKFLYDFKQIHSIYKDGSLEESTYRTVVDNLLSNLKE